MALADDARARWRGQCSPRVLRGATRRTPAWVGRDPRGDRPPDEGHRLRHPGARAGYRHCNGRLGAGVRAGLALGRRRRFGHATMGSPPVSQSRTPRAPAKRHRLHRPRLRLVPGAARCSQGAKALVSPHRRFPTGADLRRRAPHAAGHCRRGHGRPARARHSAHRHGQVALLPNSRDLPLRQDRRADGGDLAPSRADGGPGGGAGEARDRVLCDGQRDALHARAGRCT